MAKKRKKGKKGSLLRRLVRKRIKKPKIKKAVNKVRKKAKVKKTVKKPTEEEKFEVGFEEVIVKCPSCGRQFRVVKSSGFSIEGMLCQRCAAGGGVGLEGGDDF